MSSMGWYSDRSSPQHFLLYYCPLSYRIAGYAYRSSPMYTKTIPADQRIIFACYPRVSTDEQAETNLSIPTQIDRCKEFIARLPNAVLPKEYILADDES